MFQQPPESGFGCLRVKDRIREAAIQADGPAMVKAWWPYVLSRRGGARSKFRSVERSQDLRPRQRMRKGAYTRPAHSLYVYATGTEISLAGQ